MRKKTNNTSRDEKITELLDQSLDILKQEIAYMAESIKKESLSHNSNRCLNDSIRTLLIAAKGIREQEKAIEDDLSQLSDEELQEMAKKALSKAKE